MLCEQNSVINPYTTNPGRITKSSVQSSEPQDALVKICFHFLPNSHIPIKLVLDADVTILELTNFQGSLPWECKGFHE